MVTTNAANINSSIDQANDIIIARNWELPVASLDGWRPFTAVLTPDDLEGPAVRTGHGMTLNKDVMGFASGARGACKSVTISYLAGKEMRMGKPCWSNYPISFYVAERGRLTGNESNIFMQMGPCWWRNIERSLSYYESMPLDMDKFYTFHQELRKGAVVITELPLFFDNRASLTGQNRIGGYQIMQIRKTANSFIYDLQNPKWVDNRFGWSADFEIECSDVAKMRYDHDSLGRDLEEGELTRWYIKDLSGLMTGVPFRKNERLIGPYQFYARLFWNIYPTHFIVDAYEAANSFKKDKAKQDSQAKVVAAVESTINDYLEQEIYKIPSQELMEAIKAKTDEEVSNITLGKILSSLGVETKQNGRGKRDYYLEPLLEGAAG